jgi:hypothetical protein
VAELRVNKGEVKGKKETDIVRMKHEGVK